MIKKKTLPYCHRQLEKLSKADITKEGTIIIIALNNMQMFMAAAYNTNFEVK